VVTDLAVDFSVAQARARARVFTNTRMRAVVRISRTRLGPVVDGTQLMEPGATVYEGPAKVSGGSGPVTYTVGEEVQYYSSAKAGIPIMDGPEPTAPQVSDLLQVLEHDDPLMVGRRWRIVDVETQGELVEERVLQLVGVQSYSGVDIDQVVFEQPPSAQDGIPAEWRL
jgi:hypothetical protein